MGRSFLFTRQYVSNHMEYHGIGRSAGVQRQLDSRIGYLILLDFDQCLTPLNCFFCFVRLILCRRCHVAEHSTAPDQLMYSGGRSQTDSSSCRTGSSCLRACCCCFNRARVRWNHHFLKPSVSVG